MPSAVNRVRRPWATGAVARAWVTWNRVIRRTRMRRLPDRRERRWRWIEENAPGRTFADIGGLFRISGDNALRAERAGATEVTLFDVGDIEYTEFPKLREERGSSIRFVQGDLEDPVAVERIGPHDIVWCTGVIYHTPNPVRQLMALREITRETLYLGTHCFPEVPGLENACIYLPHLTEGTRRAYSKAYADNPMALGIGAPFDDRPMTGHGNFWWGISPSALRSMLATARFEVVEEHRDPFSPYYIDVIARPVERDPLLPPLSYFRERREARDDGREPPPFEEYYEELRKEEARG